MYGQFCLVARVTTELLGTTIIYKQVLHIALQFLFEKDVVAEILIWCDESEFLTMLPGMQCSQNNGPQTFFLYNQYVTTWVTSWFRANSVAYSETDAQLNPESHAINKQCGKNGSWWPIGLYRDVWIASSRTRLATLTGAMRITFVTRKFGNVERNSHCDILHITPIRVARLFLDCNGDFAIKAYETYPCSHRIWTQRHKIYPSSHRSLTLSSSELVINSICPPPIRVSAIYDQPPIRVSDKYDLPPLELVIHIICPPPRGLP